MSVFRISKTKNFTVMSNYHFKEKGMSLKAKGLLSLMLSLPDDWDYSISGLVRLSKDGKDSVMTALTELEKFGYLTRTQLTNEKGQFSGIEYNIFEEPQEESAVPENQNSDNQISENSNSEKPRQLNTNSINHLENKDIKELSTKVGGLIPDEIYDILIDEIEDDELRELYMDYVLMRNETSPLTPTGLKKLIGRGFRLSEFNLNIHKSIVETAIINNWQNIYAPKPEEKINRNNVLEEHGKILFGKQIPSAAIVAQKSCQAGLNGRWANAVNRLIIKFIYSVGMKGIHYIFVKKIFSLSRFFGQTGKMDKKYFSYTYAEDRENFSMFFFKMPLSMEILLK